MEQTTSQKKNNAGKTQKKNLVGSVMVLGSGIADARRMLELGVNLGIGTDGANCADNQNMYEAMRTALASDALGAAIRNAMNTEPADKGPDETRAMLNAGLKIVGTLFGK